MNYSDKLAFHVKNDAEAAISVISVPYEEASRYGIMSNGRTRAHIRIPGEARKSEKHAGVHGRLYIYMGCAEEYLIRDEQTEDSDHDFGKGHHRPCLLTEGGCCIQVQWVLEGCGTIQAYWESSMDLVKRVPEFNLYDPEWRIYTPNPVKPPHYIASTGSVKTSVVAEGCMIYGTVRNSVLFPLVLLLKRMP